MRAREFTINVPITIKINGDGDPEVEMDKSEEDTEDGPELASNFIPPLQQKLEIMKGAAGKRSAVLNQLSGAEDDEVDGLT